MAKRKPTQMELLKYGPDLAKLKASMPAKRWKRLVKFSHGRGHTVAGELSGAPNALKERTDVSLRDEAQRTVGDAYKPVMGELSRREAAAGFLEKKRADDDAAYRTWMLGEADKLDAQARAADATLIAQQGSIATDLNAAQAAAHADSIKRVAGEAGNVSDPAQSTALDQSAADQRSREMVASARDHTAQIVHIGDQGDQIARAALVATAAVREATRRTELWKTEADISADRTQAIHEQAKDATGLLQGLRDKEVTKAQSNREYDLAAGELGAKAQSLAATIKENDRKYDLDRKKFNLSVWVAKHAQTTAKAKLQIEYDKLAAAHGKDAADRALKKWIAKYEAGQANKRARTKIKDEKAGVSSDERKLYQDVETARRTIAHWHQLGKDPSKLRSHLINLGISNVMVDVANDLWRNGGVLSPHGVTKARRIGIEHVGYFWDVPATSVRPQTGTPAG